MKIEIYPPLSIHEVGQRSNQEDSLWPSSDGEAVGEHLFVVCDGMGGHEHGEVASRTVSQALGQWFKHHAAPKEELTDDQLRDAIEYAYTELDRHDSESQKKMGTTLTLLYIHARGITAAHIGDSRIYHLRPEEGLRYLSRDHSVAFELMQSGEISYEEYLRYPQKNIITRVMMPGEDNRSRPDIVHITDVEAGDYFYLCSDGMVEQMSDEELMNIFAADATDEEKRDYLVRDTSSNSDNHSAWIVHIRSVEHEEGDEIGDNEEASSRCNALNVIKNRR